CLQRPKTSRRRVRTARCLLPVDIRRDARRLAEHPDEMRAVAETGIGSDLRHGTVAGREQELRLGKPEHPAGGGGCHAERVTEVTLELAAAHVEAFAELIHRWRHIE